MACGGGGATVVGSTEGVLQVSRYSSIRVQGASPQPQHSLHRKEGFLLGTHL